MTDQTLRELERRYRESGTPADEAAWIRARLQAGTLPELHVQLAAALGSEAARSCAEPLAQELADLVELALRRDAREAALRLLLAAVRWVPREAWVTAGVAATPLLAQDPDLERVQAYVSPIEAWLLRCAESGPSVYPDVEPRLLSSSGEAGSVLELRHLERAAGLPTDDACASAQRLLAGIALMARRHDRRITPADCAAEVAPWLLGIADPIRARRAAPN